VEFSPDLHAKNQLIFDRVIGKIEGERFWGWGDSVVVVAAAAACNEQQWHTD